MFLAYVPTYMREILKFNIKSVSTHGRRLVNIVFFRFVYFRYNLAILLQNGFFSSLPFLVRGTVMVVAPMLADAARSSKYLSRTTIGKIIHCIG